MGTLSRLSDKAEWNKYYEYKKERGNLPEKFLSELEEYIDQQKYLPVVEKILSENSLSYPKKSLINKSKAGRKRAVYTFPMEENYILKLMAYLLRRYDCVFAPNLYSFRKDRGVKRATEDILRIRNLNQRYVYKLDISDYFNSVDINILLPKLKATLADDPSLYKFVKGLLESSKVIFDGEVIEEKKGIMAGVPISGFLADLYLYELDWYFYNNNIPYMRYSDDIIVFADDESVLESSVKTIKDTLSQHKLGVNSEKEEFSPPGTPWNFLGFSYDNGIIDISNISFKKLKAKMKRKSRSLERWAARKHLPGVLAARAFVKRFNAKLYDNPIHNELTWTKWYFPVINTDVTLKAIDEYMQECIRYLATGKHTKAKYNFKYSDIKALGYRSLVNEYYKRKNTDL